MEETFVLQKSFGHSGRVELAFTEGDLRHEDALAVYRYGRIGDRDSLLKTAVSPTGTKVLRREADAYDRISGRHTAVGRLLGFQTAEDPVLLVVTRRGIPISRCDPGLRLDTTQIHRAARDLFGALATLADLGFAHRAVSADSVFWDGLHIELQGFGHVEPLVPVSALNGSALGSPTGLPVSDVSDVQAAARLLHRLMTGRAGTTPADMVQELAGFAPRFAEALEPALHALPGQGPGPKEMVDRLWRSGPEPGKSARSPGTKSMEVLRTPPVPQERRLEDHPHRVEFRELRRQQREIRRGGQPTPTPVVPRQTGSLGHEARKSAPSSDAGARSYLLFAVFTMFILVVVVLVVR